ncbi:L-dopachrome tautomerase-related protein [Lichenihabitans sp. Uapishka_5]|uniref:SMP-30/gluconolactonase/LRE family protein n=1 Tax=Lichenihabitans sp. Uapishka_5 TaxID=3037302 RepID=UPI0029E81EED|nr:L-dopachrome tautomerase-related protein [Lichenihabitans sp. Uapishka_5]MDX7952678.1 L-dopachrome tautomerase-related protein [Lichenihabitans sp. Uapishka_5]
MTTLLGRRALLAGTAGLAGSAGLAGYGLVAPAIAAEAARPAGVPETAPVGALELARAVAAPTAPTGLVVARDGRMFVFMPRLDAETAFSIGAVAADGSVTPWPDAAMNRPDPKRPQDTLFHIPNGVFDRQDRLWVLDAGLLAAAAVPTPGAAKLLCFDGATGALLRNIPLGPVTEPTSSLNDLRIDRDAKAVFISDQGQDGHGALIAVDLASGRASRRLARHSSTESVKGILKVVEGQVLMKRNPDGVTSPVQGGANGIALSPDGRRVYYGPLMGRQLYSVDAGTLLDPEASDAAVAATVTDLGEKGMTGGLLCDDQDRLYLALQEFNGIGRRWPDGRIEVLATDPRLIWADTFWITPDRWLYVSSSQVNRRKEFNGGIDKVQPPYAMLRMRIDAGPA